MKSWVKLWTEYVDDPKILTLSWAHRGIYAAMLALAGQLDYRDENDNETGELDTIPYMAIRLRCEQRELEEALACMAERDMVEVRDGVVFVLHFRERQSRPPSTHHERVQERVTRHRAKVCNNVVTTPQQHVTPPDPDPESDPDPDPESSSPQAPPRGAEGDDDDGHCAESGEVYRLWEEINPRRQASVLDISRLDDFMADHGAPAVAAAIRAANEYGKPTLAYVRGVLDGNGRSPPGTGKSRARLSAIDKVLGAQK